ncbi:hypothetical protein Dimus_002642 [Dionaea muscipula]
MQKKREKGRMGVVEGEDDMAEPMCLRNPKLFQPSGLRNLSSAQNIVREIVWLAGGGVYTTTEEIILMEYCIEARALKASCLSQFAMISSSQQQTTSFPDEDDGDFWCDVAAGINGVFPTSDDFSVDEFFDLPADEYTEPEQQGKGSLLDIVVEEEEEEENEHEGKDSSTLSLSSTQDHLDDGHSNSSSSSSSGSLSVQDLCFQVCPVTRDMEELELWSHLLDQDDSVSEASLANPIVLPGLHGANRSEPEKKPVGRRTPCIPTAFPVRPRSGLPRKNRLQARSGVGGSTQRAESSPAAKVVGGTGTTMLMNPVHDLGPFFFSHEPPQRKRKKPEGEQGMGGSAAMQQRRCTHCQVQSTPQWRAGPLGPKSLCNACGVRFKKGRLYPEYRPACSPTFSMGIHSNSHRKVMEMRTKKKHKEIIKPDSRPGSMILGC